MRRNDDASKPTPTGLTIIRAAISDRLMTSVAKPNTNANKCKYTIYRNHTNCMYTRHMNDLLTSLALVGAAVGITAVLGTLVWCWVKLSLRHQKQHLRH